jgi:signal transduction histidine kinase
MSEDGGTAVLAQEALTSHARACIVQHLHDQPSWSDFPLIILVGRGQGSRGESSVTDMLRPLGHVTLLERPVRKATLVSAVSAALRSRMRQYDVRDNLEELQRAEREIRMANEQLEVARNEAIHASRVKSQFLANMSHELRTPLNAILGYAEMLCEEPTITKNLELVGDMNNIVAAGRHLLELINDILDLSKIEAGQMNVTREVFDVDDLIEGVARTISPLMRRNSNVFHVEKREQLGVAISDEIKLRQGLLNLLSNASKFTERGAVTLSAQRRKVDNEEWLEFAVRDTGIGIAPEDLERLGTDFVQLDSSQTRKYGGTGLGLSLTRRFAEMLGGSLHIDSEQGKGSTFTIHVPAGTV